MVLPNIESGSVSVLLNQCPPLDPAPGDLNCDGVINALDIEPFVIALFEPGAYALHYPDCDINLGDINGDGAVDALDIEPFLNILFP